MHTWRFDDHNLGSGKTTWWVGPIDKRDVLFPSNDRIEQIWKKSAKNSGELVVIKDDGTNHRIVEIPKGIATKRRRKFIEALTQEVEAAQ